MGEVIQQRRDLAQHLDGVLFEVLVCGVRSPARRAGAAVVDTTDPQQAVHALRGLKQGFARATSTTQRWTFDDTFTAHYAVAYSGVRLISLGESFCRAVHSLLHIG